MKKGYLVFLLFVLLVSCSEDNALTPPPELSPGFPIGMASQALEGGYDSICNPRICTELKPIPSFINFKPESPGVQVEIDADAIYESMYILNDGNFQEVTFQIPSNRVHKYSTEDAYFYDGIEEPLTQYVDVSPNLLKESLIFLYFCNQEEKGYDCNDGKWYAIDGSKSEFRLNLDMDISMKKKNYQVGDKTSLNPPLKTEIESSQVLSMGNTLTFNSVDPIYIKKQDFIQDISCNPGGYCTSLIDGVVNDTSWSGEKIKLKFSQPTILGKLTLRSLYSTQIKGKITYNQKSLDFIDSIIINEEVTFIQIETEGDEISEIDFSSENKNQLFSDDNIKVLYLEIEKSFFKNNFLPKQRMKFTAIVYDGNDPYTNKNLQLKVFDLGDEVQSLDFVTDENGAIFGEFTAPEKTGDYYSISLYENGKEMKSRGVIDNYDYFDVGGKVFKNFKIYNTPTTPSVVTPKIFDLSSGDTYRGSININLPEKNFNLNFDAGENDFFTLPAYKEKDRLNLQYTFPDETYEQRLEVFSKPYLNFIPDGVSLKPGTTFKGALTFKYADTLPYPGKKLKIEIISKPHDEGCDEFKDEKLDNFEKISNDQGVIEYEFTVPEDAKWIEIIITDPETGEEYGRNKYVVSSHVQLKLGGRCLNGILEIEARLNKDYIPLSGYEVKLEIGEEMYYLPIEDGKGSIKISVDGLLYPVEASTWVNFKKYIYSKRIRCGYPESGDAVLDLNLPKNSFDYSEKISTQVYFYNQKTREPYKNADIKIKYKDNEGIVTTDDLGKANLEFDSGEELFTGDIFATVVNSKDYSCYQCFDVKGVNVGKRPSIYLRLNPYEPEAGDVVEGIATLEYKLGKHSYHTLGPILNNPLKVYVPITGEVFNLVSNNLGEAKFSFQIPSDYVKKSNQLVGTVKTGFKDYEFDEYTTYFGYFLSDFDYEIPQVPKKKGDPFTVNVKASREKKIDSVPFWVNFGTSHTEKYTVEDLKDRQPKLHGSLFKSFSDYHTTKGGVFKTDSTGSKSLTFKADHYGNYEIDSSDVLHYSSTPTLFFRVCPYRLKTSISDDFGDISLGESEVNSDCGKLGCSLCGITDNCFTSKTWNVKSFVPQFIIEFSGPDYQRAHVSRVDYVLDGVTHSKEFDEAQSYFDGDKIRINFDPGFLERVTIYWHDGDREMKGELLVSKFMGSDLKYDNLIYVSDEDGSPMPNVQVLSNSPNYVSCITDENGECKIPYRSPKIYEGIVTEKFDYYLTKNNVPSCDYVDYFNILGQKFDLKKGQSYISNYGSGPVSGTISLEVEKRKGSKESVNQVKTIIESGDTFDLSKIWDHSALNPGNYRAIAKFIDDNGKVFEIDGKKLEEKDSFHVESDCSKEE